MKHSHPLLTKGLEVRILSDTQLSSSLSCRVILLGIRFLSAAALSLGAPRASKQKIVDYNEIRSGGLLPPE
jgi:hypothetical protein